MKTRRNPYVRHDCPLKSMQNRCKSLDVPSKTSEILGQISKKKNLNPHTQFIIFHWKPCRIYGNPRRIYRNPWKSMQTPIHTEDIGNPRTKPRKPYGLHEKTMEIHPESVDICARLLWEPMQLRIVAESLEIHAKK